MAAGWEGQGLPGRGAAGQLRALLPVLAEVTRTLHFVKAHEPCDDGFCPLLRLCVLTLQNKGTKKIGQKGYGHSGECYQTPAVVIVLSLPSNFHQIGFQLFSFFFSAHFVFGLQG